MLLEREEELRLLADLLAETESGGKVVLIRGEAGIGKTSLVREFIELQAGKAHMLAGTCDDLLIPQPLGAFWDMAREEPLLGEPLWTGDRPHLLETVLDLLSHSLRPTIMAIEDTQWPMRQRWTRSGMSVGESAGPTDYSFSPIGTARWTSSIPFGG